MLAEELRGLGLRDAEQDAHGIVLATIPATVTHVAPTVAWIAHFDTGGVPGRNQIDDTQEINYPAVMRAIVETGFKGFVAQEFVPKRAEPLESLREGVRICDV